MYDSRSPYHQSIPLGAQTVCLKPARPKSGEAMEQRVSLSKAGAMKVPLFNRSMTLSCLYISAMALLIGLRLASVFIPATSEWLCKTIARPFGLAGGRAL